MKILLEILDNKADALLEVLKSMRHVKTTTLTDGKALLMKEVKEAVDEMKLIRAGKKHGRDADYFLNRL